MKQNKKTNTNNTNLSPDEQVQKMLETWDIVKCQICGKEISMLDSIPLKGEEGFICKKHKNTL